ncbi:MAG: DNA polymerase III subunit alpha [Waddliaceae bacterium]
MWVPLHVHSQYSILDASASVQGIVEKAAAFGMPAVALTDHGNIFGAVEFYKACVKAQIKPIVGCEVYVAPNSRFDKKKQRGERAAYHLTLLAKNRQGYHHLCRLTSLGYLEGFYYHPRIDHELLEKYSEGIICLSGCMSSRIAQEVLQGDREKLSKTIDRYIQVFGDDFYLELQRHPMTEDDLQADGIYQEAWLSQKYHDYVDKQDKVNTVLIEIAREKNLPVVATNDSHYLDRSDWRAHEILLNIQSGEPCETWERDSQGKPKVRVPNPKRRTYPSHECYFKSPQEISRLFQDIPEAIAATVGIAEKCDVALDFKTKHYPVFVPPVLEGKTYDREQRGNEVEKFLWKLCKEGIGKRYTPERLAKVKEVYPHREPLEVIEKRLDHEMDVIVSKEMCDYLLIVWDFIYWAKKSGIPVGPGRGSGAGSIVLYLIGVTDIEPLRFNLFFERFINPERFSYPDVDVDICMDRRGDVMQYILQKYGKDNVAQIITFGTMKAKMVIRDVGRVLSVPLVKVNAIAKLVPDDLNITLESAIEKDRDLRNMYETDEETKNIIDLGKKIEGSIRNTGIHAAGVIISGEPLTNQIPICLSKDSDMPVTQYSMKPVEAVGMLKMDFLGLKTLTAIQIATEAVKANTGKEIDWVDLDLDDQATFALLNQGKTLGVFQLESGGMQALARHLHLDKFEEIIAVGALYRPGPMDMIPSFINRKHGKEPIEYDHPLMKEILAETYGIMVYQEQVMQIASQLGNYSLGEGDVLRRAMGKKDREQMAKEREKFRLGALENRIEEETAMQIFDKMEKFAAYGFNKSHAAAYGYIAYVTAYFKANYPGEWMAALMTCDRDDLAKVAKLIREAQSMNISILPPDVNEAGEAFVAAPQGIRFAMNGIKGVGSGVVEAIVQERKRNGLFKNFYQFFKRIDTKKVGKKMIESLVWAGCFDFTGWSRDALRQSIEPMYEAAVKEKREDEVGIMSLFSLIGETSEKRFSQPPEVMIQTSRQDILLKEKELLGFFLTGHPMDSYQKILERLSSIPLRRIETLEHETVFRSAVLVDSVKVRVSSKSQRKFAILTISDGMAGCELPIWSELFEEKHHLLQENRLLYTVLQIDKSEEQHRLTCHWLDDLTRMTDEMIADCDRAYDQAKHQKNNRSYSRKTSPSTAKRQASSHRKVLIVLDVEQTRHSHILQLKTLFREHRGKNPVQLDFSADNRTVASLHIGTDWGVATTSTLQESVAALSPVLSMDVKSS